MISTKSSYLATVVNTGNTNSKNELIMKPQVVLDYNEERQGIDLSDQLSADYTRLRRSIGNSYLIYKGNYAASKVTVSRKVLFDVYYVTCHSKR